MVATVSRPPLIDRSSGNINIHGRGGAKIVYRRRDKTTGAFLDISADALFFEVNGLYRAALAGGSDATMRLIVIPESLSAQLIPLRQGFAFALRDETAEPFKVRLAGMITAYGFNTAPA